MDPRSAYRLQLMDKLGAPLFSVLPEGMAGEKAAETVAALIAKSVQAGLQLSQSMKLSDDDGNADSIRLALTAIAAPLVGQAYKDSGKIPDDAVLEKLTKGLEATLVFAENFTAAQEHTARLKSLHEPLPLMDLTQVNLLVLNALVPVVQALQQFSFGQSETALVREISERLQKTASELSGAMVKGGEEDLAFSRLMLLRALAEIYAGCHDRVRRAHQGNDAPSHEAVWNAYDEQVAMMAALSGAVFSDRAPETVSPDAKVPGSSEGTSGPMGFFKKPGEATAASPTPAPMESSVLPPSSVPPVSSGGPMSFFKPGSKKSDSNNEE